MEQSTRQLHVRLPDGDHDFICAFAERRGESVATIVRRLIRSLRLNARRTGESDVPAHGAAGASSRAVAADRNVA